MPNGMYVRGMSPGMMGGRAAPYPSPAMHMAQKRTGQFPGGMPAQVRRPGGNGGLGQWGNVDIGMGIGETGTEDGIGKRKWETKGNGRQGVNGKGIKCMCVRMKGGSGLGKEWY